MEFLILVNFLPGDDINVDSIKEININENGFIKTHAEIPKNSLPDKGCVNEATGREVLISKTKWEKVIKPILR